MLTQEENRTLTAVGPGTRMGALLREYWMPALLSPELPGADAPPVRVMLLAERLVAFRDSSGHVGLVTETCPHRRASLFFGTNRDGGLRCAYHGWKFGVDGHCMDMPTEPRYGGFRERVQTIAYPCVERGGIVWTYMGARKVPPPLPEIEPNMTPASTAGASLIENNWLQSVEGDIDLAHIPHLHGGNLAAFADLYYKAETPNSVGRLKPRNGMRFPTPIPVEIEDTAAGFAYARSRGLFGAAETWEVGQYLFPFYSNLPYGELGTHWVVARVPMDDNHTMSFSMWSGSTPQAPPELMFGPEPCHLPNTTDWFGRFRLARNGSNDFGLDRTRGAAGLPDGVQGQGVQDAAVTWSMGSVVDRTKECLGSADTAIIHLRHRLLNAVAGFERDGAPGVDTPSAYRVQHGVMQVDAKDAWQNELARRTTATVAEEPGVMLKAGARESAEIQRMFMQYWTASAILAAANLGVADAVDDNPRPVGEIASAIDAEPQTLCRLLRALAAFGIFREGPAGCFAQTSLSAALRDDAPGRARSLIRMFGLRSFREAMNEYEFAIRTGRSAHEKAHGEGRKLSELLEGRPDEAALYYAGMNDASDLALPITEFCDFSDIDLLVDVGGGWGGFLSAILQKNSGQRGVLFDLPDVVAQAGPTLLRYDVESRCAAIGGNMHEDVPAGGGGYILKYVLHSLADAQACALLRRIREKGAPPVRVFVIENVMPEDSSPAPCKTFDLFLLLAGNGARARTAREFEALFEEAGFRMNGITPLIGTTSLVEGLAR